MFNRQWIFLFLVLSTFAFSDVDKKKSVTALFGIPHPVAAAYDYRIAPKLSAGITAGMFGFMYTHSTGHYDLGMSNIEARVRFHPFIGTFFVGVAGGYQAANGETDREMTVSGTPITVTGKAEAKNMYVIPHFGWLVITKSGFTFGFEAGLYLPFSPSSSVMLSSTNPLISQASGLPEYQQMQSDVEKIATDLATLKLPYLTLLRVGWSF